MQFGRQLQRGGSYNDSTNYPHAFVVDETNGTWGSAEEIPGFATLDSSGLNSSLLAISCSTNGNCSAGGVYGDGSNDAEAFVVDETNGTWGSAQEVPGSGALNVDNVAFISAMDCTSTGTCGAGGYYTDSSNDGQAFVVDETNGTWGNAIELPGSAALNVGGSAAVLSISCSSGGDCGAGGLYSTSTMMTQSFVANETNGTWGTAAEVTGINSSGATAITSIACSSPGNCSAGGAYNDANNNTQAFAMDETNGVWQSSVEVPDIGLLNLSGNSSVAQVACSSVGYCSAGGYYTDGSHNQQAFVVNESGGTWSNALEVPGTSTLNTTGDALAQSISCSADGSCGIGGYYQDSSNNSQAFVDGSAALFTAPKAPSIRASSKAKGALLITVTNSSANGGSPITEYQYSLNGGTWIDSSHHALASFRIEHLKAGETYRVAVRAVNVVGTGVSSVHRSVKID